MLIIYFVDESRCASTCVATFKEQVAYCIQMTGFAVKLAVSAVHASARDSLIRARD